MFGLSPGQGLQFTGFRVVWGLQTGQFQVDLFYRFEKLELRGQYKSIKLFKLFVSTRPPSIVDLNRSSPCGFSQGPEIHRQ